MSNHMEEHGNGLYNIRNVFLGMLIGGLAGAAAMILLAPQSGKQTRDQIRLKGIQLRDQVTDTMQNTLAQVRSETQTVKDSVREKAGELKHLGQDQLVKQLDRASAAVKAA
ncbi:MAG: YtxH domain-containing protein [Anaerolineales bacterium]|nr:YtxH domain-containing protein [Anaerolineales bacterium]